MSARRALLGTLLLPLSACGGGSSPSRPGSVPPPGGGSGGVPLVVFYDENGKGAPDPGEAPRVPDVEVGLGGRMARSAVGPGRAVIDGVGAGTFPPAVTAATLPPFYTVGRLN